MENNGFQRRRSVLTSALCLLQCFMTSLTSYAFKKMCYVFMLKETAKTKLSQSVSLRSNTSAKCTSFLKEHLQSRF